MNKRLLLVFGIIIIGLLAISILAGNKNLSNNNGRIQVTASFYPMYFFATQIAGNKADVYSITPASAEPHDYEPSAQDIARIQNSRMLILNGGALEAWGNKIKDDLSDKNVLVVTAGEGLADRQIEEEGKTIQDPHVWLDPILAKEEVGKIEKGFEKIDPANSLYYQTNAGVLDSKLDQLDQEYKQRLTSCSKTDFVTSHAAFGYLGREFGINQVAISGVSPDEEPSTQKLAEVSDLVKKENIKVIFFESLVSPKLSQTIANETGAKAMVLDPIEGITQEDAAKGATYLTVMQNNLHNLRIALECK